MTVTSGIPYNAIPNSHLNPLRSSLKKKKPKPPDDLETFENPGFLGVDGSPKSVKKSVRIHTQTTDV